MQVMKLLIPHLHPTADSTVFALTIYRSLKLSRIAGGGVSSLINLIMRDGASPLYNPVVLRTV